MNEQKYIIFNHHNPKKESVLSIIDWFIPPFLKGDIDTQRQARFTVSVLFVSIFYYLAFFLYYQSLDKEVFYLTTFFSSLSSFALLLFYKAYGKGKVIANGICVILISLISIQTYFGVGLSSYDLVWIIFVPIVAVYFLHLQATLIWGGISLAVITALHILEEKKVTAPDFVADKINVWDYYSNLAPLFVLLMIVLILYKRGRDKVARTIAEAHTEIQNSVNYAKEIQHSMLPEPEILQGTFPDSFIYFQPKDIVSGDFYWFSKKENKFMIAAADCTGHGVPGAFMSVLGLNILNRIALSSPLTKPSYYLTELHEEVRKALGQNKDHSISNDGMDIAFARVKRDTLMLDFSGAFRPLYIVNEDRFIELKGDRNPIGGRHMEMIQHYENQEVQLLKGDCIYLFSDGYPDQFGGEKGKKLMNKRFKDLLIRIHKEPMTKQKELINETFNSWKGDLEQVDDILIMGFRV